MGPSTEQYTGVAHLFSLHSPPYAGFFVFGPYVIRNRKRMRLNGYRIAGDGALHKCELH